MDMLKGLASGGDSKKESDKPKSGSVVEAVKSTFTSTEPDKVDKPNKVAGAGDEVLETAKGYLKTGEEGVGKIVNKAGEYIHKYTPAAEADKPAPPPAKKEESGSGLGGDALKKAGDFFKK